MSEAVKFRYIPSEMAAEIDRLVARVEESEEANRDLATLVARLRVLGSDAPGVDSPLITRAYCDAVEDAVTDENRRLRTETAVKIRAAWHGLDEGQPRGEVMEYLAAIAHELDTLGG
jgi:hypothetical protein